MLNIRSNGLSGSARVSDIKEMGLVNASLRTLDKEKTIRRIRTYSDEEYKGKDLFWQLGLDYV